jgi:hypothetical protein
MLDEPVDSGKAPLLQKEVVQVHLDVHVHLNAPPLGGLVYPTAQGFDGGGRSLAGHAPGAGGQPSRLLSRASLVIVFVLGGVFAYKAGTGALVRVAAAPDAPALAATSTPAARLPSRPLAAALDKELQEPPVITPAPGAPSPVAPSGPSVFGLN